MADVTLHLNRIRFVVVAPYLDKADPFVVIRLDEGNDDTRIHVMPATVQRAREVAAAIVAACDAVEDAVRRQNAVDVRSLSPDAAPIESLAPTDPLLAPVLREESDIERATRLGPHAARVGPTQPAA